MEELYFKAELLDDIVLSMRTATVGDHKSLDYIPGSVFLGIAASRFYNSMGGDNAWKIFHSSKVRFCNAYPMIGYCRGIPMPLSFHSEKVPRAGKEKLVLNFTFPEEREEGVQYKQNRNGYVCFNNEKINIVTPSKTTRMRTAVDAKTGTAAKTQLYSYESLNAGQIFLGKIQWDDSVSELIEPIKDIFTSGEIVRVGRSKTASYGRVQISKLDDECVEERPNDEDLNGKTFSILAVSDLCLKDFKTGTPKLIVTPDFLGLGNNWEYDEKKSFSRPFSICQYNAYRNEIEMQKTLISKGSVFTFNSKSDKELTPEEKNNILTAVKNGIGNAKGQGFGEIEIFNIGKEFLKTDSDSINSVEEKELTPEEGKEELTPEEAEWLEWIKPVFLSIDVEDVVEKYVDKFVELCKKIRKNQNFDKRTVFWPKRAQWGKILKVSRLCKSKKDLYSKLFEGETCIIKPIIISRIEKNDDLKEKNPDKEWNYPASYENDTLTLRNWLSGFINDSAMNDKETKIALQELVKRCKDKISDKDWLNGGAR